MRVKNMVTVGFLSMVVATGVASASDGAASRAQGVNVMERMGAGGSAYSSSQPDGADACPVTGVRVTGRIGHGGSTYSVSPSESVPVGNCHAMEGKRVDSSERIGAGGSTYFSSRSTIQTATR